MNLASVPSLILPFLLTAPALSAQEYALRYEGAGIVFPHHPAMNTGDAFTVEAWVRAATPSPGTMNIIARYSASAEHKQVYVRPDGSIWYIYAGSPWPDVVSAPQPSLLDGGWHHLAFVRRPNGDHGAFLDGVQISGGGPGRCWPFTCNIINANTVTNVGYPNDTGWEIDELRISSTDRYWGVFTPQRSWASDADTVMLLGFDEGMGSTVYDASSYAQVGTIRGTWTWVPLSGGPATTERVSLRSTGAQAVQPSGAPSVSGDGRWVAFQSEDSSMVPGDTNGVRDVFLRDTLNGTTTRISVATGGGQANGASSSPDISDDGRYVAFHSEATNLVANDTNGAIDVFLHDRVLGTTIRVSLTNGGGQTDGDSVGGVVSADGEYVAFRSWATNIPNNPDTNGVSDIFRWDRTLGTVRRISVANSGQEPNQECLGPTISATGRYVAFYTKADNLLPPLQDYNGAYDVYLRDVFLGTTELVSKTTSGVIGDADSSECSISGDGQSIAFRSAATNLVPGDGNGVADVFLRDFQSGTTERISLSSSGAEANGGSVAPAISEDGAVVAFESVATNLVSGDTNGKKDVFVRDLQTGITSRASVSTAGAQGDRQSIDPAVSGDGRFVVFESTATNLVPGDTNLAADVFRRDRGSPDVQLAKSGTCPGTITLTVTNATPNRNVAIAYGPAGSFTLNQPPCAGLTLDLGSPTLGAIRQADASGAVSLSFPVGGGACGISVQVVDITTCRKSGAIQL